MKDDKTMTPEEFQKRVDRVLTRLGIRWPFFCQVLASRKIHYDESVPTLATDGPNIYCNPTFWASNLTNDTEISGVAHELLHIVLEHPWRRGPRDPRLFNIACDFKVNQYLEEEGFVIDPNWLRDKQYDAMSEEQIYAELEKHGGKGRKPGGKGDKPCNDGDPAGGDGDGMNPDFDDLKQPQGTKEKQAQDREDLRSAVIRAFNTYKAQGNGGGLAEYLADKVVKVSEPWYEHLRRLMTRMTLTESNWRRMNRREYLRTGVIAADIGKLTIEHLVIVEDTSGSIGQVTHDYFFGHINSILEDVAPKKLTVIACDAKVNAVWEFTPDEFPITVKIVGGGGTDFRPAFKHVEGLEDVDALIYLTDTFGTYPEQQPEYPVFWASIYEYEQCSKPPFGEFIFIDESH